MPSPNGYVTSETQSNTDRNWFRFTLGYDANNAPWNTPQVGNYEFDLAIGTAPAGPFTPAPVTGPGSDCSAAQPSTFAPGGLTSTVMGIGGPAALLANTPYWLRIILRDPDDVEVENYVAGPFTTSAYPTMTCLGPTDVTQTSGTVDLAMSSGRLNVTSPCNQDTVVWELATAPAGPWTAQPSEPVNDFTPSHTFTGLTPNTTYYARARFTEQAQTQGEYLVTEPCTFTTLEAVVTTPPFNPQPCATGGAGGGGADVENVVLCDLDAEGNLLGTALAVYEYDETGTPVGAPTFVNPATGVAYVPQGTLQVCPDAACLPPMQFCQTGTTTGPVDHPGRQYDLALPINQGFAVDSLVVDAVTHPAGITWSIFDVDGSQFATDLQSFIQGRMPAGATVTVNNPNAGATEICGAATPMTVHIECIRLDENPPNLIELVYNGGEDLIRNPGYNTTPPTDLSQFQFYYLQRQDAGGTVNCTSVANRGWETNDLGGNATRDFEIWGTGPSGLAAIQNTTPTPRGTPVQEVTADINDTGAGPTIWQTFNVPSPGNFRVQLVHGARDTGEQHTIRLSTGDTNDTGPGDIINNVTTPPSVTNSGGPNPWTVLDQTVPLNSGLYTFSFQTTNPVGPNRGGLFTDMRVYVDRPGQRATAVTDDDTCVVTTEETTTNTVCSFWQPQCVGGTVAGWQKVDTGEQLSNAEFWAQVPTPACCRTEAAEGGEGGTVQSNMLASDIVCVTIGGIRSQAIRYIVTDPSGGVLQEQFIGTSGAPASPDSWTAGDCTAERFVFDAVLCDVVTGPGGQTSTPFLRKYVQSINETGQGQINNFRDFLLDGSATYTPQGTVGTCDPAPDPDREVVCFTYTATGSTVHTGTIRHDDALPAPGWILFDQHQTPVLSTEPGLTFVPCSEAMDPIATTGLCLPGGVPIAIVLRRNSVTGVVIQDGWINLTTGAFTAGNPPVGTIACGDSSSVQVSGTFCSVDTATGDVLALILIEYTYNPDGTIASTRLVNAVDGTTYVVPAGAEITTCPTGEELPDQDLVILCDDNGSFLRDYRRDDTGAVVAVSDYTLAGAPYATVGTVRTCVADVQDTEVYPLCDVVAGVPVPFLRRQTFDLNGAVVATVDTTPAGAPYVVAGTVQVCTELDAETQVLCDLQANGTRVPYIRRITYNTVSGLQVGTNTTTLDGAAYTVTGTSVVCDGRDAETFILCDSAATPNRFLRTYRYAPDTGAIVGFTDTTLAGAAFVPTGAVGVCATTVQSDTDFVEEILCDSNGTAFIRLFRFNSTTGALVSTTNTTLAGAAFAPVGAVGLCSDCCPVVVAEGCTNTGSGRYVAIRAANGAITLLDAITGAAVTQANIVACPADATETVTAQHRLIGDADAAWTPGTDVTGTLVGVTYTVLSGTATVVDASGDSAAGLPAGLTASWNTEDDANTLTGPQSIDAVGGQVYVHWTQRP